MPSRASTSGSDDAHASVIAATIAAGTAVAHAAPRATALVAIPAAEKSPTPTSRAARVGTVTTVSAAAANIDATEACAATGACAGAGAGAGCCWLSRACLSELFARLETPRAG